MSSDNKTLELRHLTTKKINLRQTPGGHLVVNVRNKEESEQLFEENECNDDVNGVEADSVLLTAIENSADDEEIENLHNIIGHDNFVALTLNEDEKKEIMKAHRYFGHRSGRKIWEIFSKAGRLQKKKKEVFTTS